MADAVLFFKNSITLLCNKQSRSYDFSSVYFWSLLKKWHVMYSTYVAKIIHTLVHIALCVHLQLACLLRANLTRLR